MKLRTISLLALTLLLAACRTPPYRTLQDNSPSTQVPATQLPDVHCQGEIPEPLKKELKDYRLAQVDDFVTSIREYAPQAGQQLTCSIFTADFNGDKLKDYAVIAVDAKTSDFRFELLLNRDNGEFGKAVVRTYKRATDPDTGVIYTTMTFKAPGESGPALRDNFPLQPGTPDRQTFIARPAIELWRALPTTPDRVPQDLNINTLAFCSEVFYFVEGEPPEADNEKATGKPEMILKTTVVCD